MLLPQPDPTWRLADMSKIWVQQPIFVYFHHIVALICILNHYLYLLSIVMYLISYSKPYGGSLPKPYPTWGLTVKPSNIGGPGGPLILGYMHLIHEMLVSWIFAKRVHLLNNKTLHLKVWEIEKSTNWIYPCQPPIILPYNISIWFYVVIGCITP